LQTLTALWLICTALATKENIEETIRFATGMISSYRGTSPTIRPSEALAQCQDRRALGVRFLRDAS